MPYRRTRLANRETSVMTNLRIDKTLKDNAQAKAEAMGLSLSQVIRLYLAKWVTKPIKPSRPVGPLNDD